MEVNDVIEVDFIPSMYERRYEHKGTCAKEAVVLEIRDDSTYVEFQDKTRGWVRIAKGGGK